MLLGPLAALRAASNRTSIGVFGSYQPPGLTETGRVTSHHVGYDWNVPPNMTAAENCDNCGRTFETALNHRSLLYWERDDTGGSATQWFHGTPMALNDSEGPMNRRVHFEFWVREGALGAGPEVNCPVLSEPLTKEDVCNEEACESETPLAPGRPCRMGVSEAKTCEGYGDRGGESGVYDVDVDGSGELGTMRAYCEQGVAGGGWMLIAQRRAGVTTNNREACGGVLYEYLDRGCGDVNILGMNASYVMVPQHRRGFQAGEVMIVQYGGGMEMEGGEGYYMGVGAGQDLFPYSELLHAHGVRYVCALNGSECDNESVTFLYSGDWYFEGGRCDGAWGGKAALERPRVYRGAYGLCEDGAGEGVSGANYEADRFPVSSVRGGYSQVKLWNYGGGLPAARGYMERIYVRGGGRCRVPGAWGGAKAHRYEYCDGACANGTCFARQLKRGVVCAVGYEGELRYEEAECGSGGGVVNGTFGGVSGECVRSCELGPWGPWSSCDSVRGPESVPTHSCRS